MNPYYSTDSGNNWNILPISSLGVLGSDSLPVIVMLNENTFYCNGKDGIYRKTDAGTTWNQLNTGLVNTHVMNLVVADNTLYANIGSKIVASSDGGESWTSRLGRIRSINGMVESNGVLYVKGSEKMAPKLYRLTAMDHTITRCPWNAEF